ncbi:hypothetical protein Ancab_014423 [Ancistrocladus abbreviatus]
MARHSTIPANASIVVGSGGQGVGFCGGADEGGVGGRGINVGGLSGGDLLMGKRRGRPRNTSESNKEVLESIRGSSEVFVFVCMVGEPQQPGARSAAQRLESNPTWSVKLAILDCGRHENRSG